MSAPTLLPSSNATDPTAAELDLREICDDTVSRLVKQALSSQGNKNVVLLLDMRPAVSHSALSIKTAVGVNVPNMLLKRPMYSLSMVTEHLTTDQEVETFSNWRRFSNIVLFDTYGATPVKGTPLFCIAQKFRKEGYSARIGYIKGGFNAFAHGHADLCSADNNSSNSSNSLSSADNSGTPPLSINHARTSSNWSPNMLSTRPSASNNNTSPPRSRLHLGSLPSMITKPVVGNTVAQTPMIENPNVNPLFESVRQAMGLNTNITEEIPVRLPSGFSIDLIREHLPTWLLNAVNEPAAKSRLARYFQKVEIIEKKRLALLMCPQVMRSGKECDYSIGSGIEKGLKNRYNNIWPFDQTRIKIKELEQGGDDYINASLLTPPFGQRTYIATQAPLPTTFLDFWKVVWEQNSRVVVMLTREVEMGRVKCHKYWPTAQEPVLDLGPVQVTFVSEYYQPYGYGDNGSSSPSSSVLVRQMRLRHLLSPQEPERTITQVQFTGWPDFGVPDTPLEVLQVIELADMHNNIIPAGSSSSSSPSSAGPMVVHCSAGCGRTGAFCVIDSVLSELKHLPESILCERSGHGKARLQLATGLNFRASLPDERVLEAMSRGGGVGGSDGSQVVIDEKQLMDDVVFATVTKFREQRLSMVQCLRQYVFCYEAILWHLAKEFSKSCGADFSFFATPKIQVPQTPAIAFPPHSRKPAASSGFGLSTGNAPNTTSNEEFSYFG
ncbi:hypothetical protein BGZ95_002600 [Linnemannia exigua]|uniref:protein-tyrosine-phosphatase n=1 Tax=Linnemannia exigua TaxID=604196 RepID=A0AAD4H2U8_9FUNG|nr:hypothetical protein BGZ95_002600 [Linnemannia exigua]